MLVPGIPRGVEGMVWRQEAMRAADIDDEGTKAFTDSG